MKLAQTIIATMLLGSVVLTGCSTKELAIGAGAAALTYGVMKHDKHHDNNNAEEQRRNEERAREWDRRHDNGYGHHYGRDRYDDRPNWER